MVPDSRFHGDRFSGCPPDGGPKQDGEQRDGYLFAEIKQLSGWVVCTPSGRAFGNGNNGDRLRIRQGSTDSTAFSVSRPG
jgi:hypothetical protein